MDVAAEDFAITGVSDNGIDQFARNALDRLKTFWSPGLSGALRGASTPRLEEGGYFSVDSDDLDVSAYPGTGIGCAGIAHPAGRGGGQRLLRPGLRLRRLRPRTARRAIHRLRPLPRAVGDDGTEFAHAMQSRFGFAASGRSIQDENPRRVARRRVDRPGSQTGEAERVSIRTPELDDVLRGFVLLQDDIAGDRSRGTATAHG